ncbi:MAG: NnrS family protein [Betaproteobacteria bacterium HGW-Betaproteobacteria-22]|nr:MAG: NnrS family protein [Betaproteobacteria bacterium HGW-Betaproteobacteria-22]
MAIVQIQMHQSRQSPGFALFNLGFRPFFLGASLFAVISMLSWMLVYFSHNTISMPHVTLSQWHAHEMLYGYALAVVAGFLLTAVKNWTGIQTLHGKPLALLFALWLFARVAFLFAGDWLIFAAIADLLFGLFLIMAIALPVIKARQWLQLGIVVKVVLLWIGNGVFYLGGYGLLQHGMTYAINGALLLFIGLILMIGRRVVPFFIERGVAEKVQLKQYRWIDISIMLLFLALFVNEVSARVATIGTWLAFTLFAINGFRLWNWHTAGLWRAPLLWSLYLSAWLVNIGFLSYALQASMNILPVLTLHFFAIGGIGLMTIAMMSRVALGHTGRDIRKPSSWLGFVFLAIIASAVFRIFAPMLAMQHYTYWVLIAAIFWVLGFAVFVVIYTPMLLKPRVDGAFG